MEDRLDNNNNNNNDNDNDNDTFSAISSAPPNRKAYSLSSHLRHGEQKRHNQHRNHSLDEHNLPNIISNTPQQSNNNSQHFSPFYYDSENSDDDFHPRYDHSVSLPNDVNNNSNNNDDNQRSGTNTMPEFTASGGVGIFKPPTRAAVHPTRPPALELRPHPLRETQVGKFLRTIGCTESQLWAGQENGVRFWNFEDGYEAGSGYCGRVSRGDEDAAPFYESANSSPTYCLMVDHGNRLVWTGHKDGKIRSWKMDRCVDDVAPFREGLSWVAHKGPVLSLIMSCYGTHILFSS